MTDSSIVKHVMEELQVAQRTQHDLRSGRRGALACAPALGLVRIAIRPLPRWLVVTERACWSRLGSTASIVGRPGPFRLNAARSKLCADLVGHREVLRPSRTDPCAERAIGLGAEPAAVLIPHLQRIAARMLRALS